MKKAYYWSLLVEPNFVQAAVWTIESDTTRVISIGPATSWETDDDLLNATDASLSSAAAKLSEDEEPSKTVFGVPPSWVSEGQIKKEYLDKLKELCTKLSLEPTGFVVVPEAIAHFIKSEEGAPLNGIVIGVGASTLDITVFKLGNLMGTVNVGRSTYLVDDVIEGLVRFGGMDNLPTRFLLYDGRSSDLEGARQELIQADWTGELSDKVKFLHSPSVEILDADRKTVAVSLAGASEIGEVTKVIFPHEIKDLQEVREGEGIEEDPQEAEAMVQSISAEDIGFVRNRDIAEEDANLVHASAVPEEIVETLNTHTKKPKMPVSLPSLHLGQFLNKIKAINFPKPKTKVKASPSFDPPPASHHLSRPINKGSFLVENKLFILAVGVLVLLVAGFLGWWFIPKAEVTVFISPRQLENRQSITLDKNESVVNASARTLPAITREITVTGEKTISTTGRKRVGEKAKGSAQIRNGTSVAINLKSGTTLVGANNLKFSLENSASVSAALSPTQPGTAVVNITAEDIGSDYNLAKDESLKVGNFPTSDVDAIVSEDLTGGSSREITAVSAADQKTLEEELSAELLDQGRVDFSAQISPDEIFIDQSITSEVLKKTFSNKVGDEAATLRLELNLKLSALVSNRTDLNTIAIDLLKDQVPPGYVLRETQIRTAFEPKGELKDDKWEFDVHFSANLLPETNSDEVIGKIQGKSKERALSILSQIPGFVRAQIKINPPLPGMLAVIPRVRGNVGIEFSSD